MEIQQHDGVVVDVAGLRQGFTSFCERERGVAGEEGGAQGCRLLPSLPPLYRPPGRGGGGQSPSRARGGGQGGALPPKASGKPPHPRVCNPRRRGKAHGGRPAH